MSDQAALTNIRFRQTDLVAVLRQLLLDLVVNRSSLLRLCQLSPGSLLSLVVCSTLNFPSLLESVTNISTSSYEFPSS